MCNLNQSTEAASAYYSGSQQDATTEAERRAADEAAYLQFLNERGEAVKLAREKYPEEYAGYQNREMERAKRIFAAAKSPV